MAESEETTVTCTEKPWEILWSQARRLVAINNVRIDFWSCHNETRIFSTSAAPLSLDNNFDF